MNIINSFILGVPFGIRVIIIVAIIVALWGIFGKIILWILSILPWSLRRVFLFIYQLIEIPITMLHKKLGGPFCKADECMASIGQKIDNFLDRWYLFWHKIYDVSWGKMGLIYLTCIVFIIVPPLIVEDGWLTTGKKIFLQTEGFLLDKVGVPHYMEDSEEINDMEEASEVVEEYQEKTQVELVVSGVNSSLLVRDIPNMQNGTALERLHNDDVVLWNGEMIFAEAEGKHVEAWVKVTTKNGIEGWSRLYYLRPTDYEEIIFYVKN